MRARRAAGACSPSTGQRLSLDPPGDPTLARVPARGPLGAAAPPLRHDARPRARRDRRAARRHARRARAARSSRTSPATTSASSSAARAGGSGRVERLALRLHPLPGGRAHRRARRPRAGRSCTARRSCRAPSTSSAASCTCSSRARRARSTRSCARSAARRATAGRQIRELQATLPGPAALATARTRRWCGPGPRSPTPSEAPRGALERARRAGRGGDVDAELIADCVHCGFCLPTLPDLRALARGDGLAARAHPPDGRRSTTARSS